MSFEASPARRGLDALLERYFFHDVLKVEWQREEPTRLAGPWVLVELGQRSEGETEAFAVWKFAIWKSTGAVYTVDHRGAVADDPIIEGTGFDIEQVARRIIREHHETLRRLAEDD